MILFLCKHVLLENLNVKTGFVKHMTTNLFNYDLLVTKYLKYNSQVPPL